MYTVFKLKTKRAPPKLITVNDYKSINKDNLQRELQSAPWNLIDIFDDADDAAWCWETMFRGTFSEHLNQRKVKVRAANEPWMTRSIRKALNKRFKLFKKAIKLGKNNAAWLEYKTMKNQCTKLIRTSKATYWEHEFQKSNDAKSFWSTVKKFQGKTKSTNIGTLIHDNKPVTSNIDKANIMNNFFSTVGKNLAESLSQITSKTPQPNSTNFTHIYQITPTVCEINLDENKFEKTFKSTVKVGKASGPDDISPTDLKLCEEESIRSLQKVIKKSIDLSLIHI